MTQDELKALVGQAAIAYVQPGSIVGVGTGSTVNQFIEALARMPERVAGETDADRRTRHEELILAALAPLKPAFLILAGYMRILTPRLLGAFRSPRGYARVVNIHPSLLPAFPGTGGYAQAWEHGAKVAGASVHLVDEGVDEGPICAQEAFSIAECRSAEEVEKMGLAVEHRLYPRALSWILEEKFEIEKMKGRPCVRPS